MTQKFPKGLTFLTLQSGLDPLVANDQLATKLKEDSTNGHVVVFSPIETHLRIAMDLGQINGEIGDEAPASPPHVGYYWLKRATLTTIAEIDTPEEFKQWDGDNWVDPTYALYVQGLYATHGDKEGEEVKEGCFMTAPTLNPSADELITWSEEVETDGVHEVDQWVIDPENGKMWQSKVAHNHMSIHNSDTDEKATAWRYGYTAEEFCEMSAAKTATLITSLMSFVEQYNTDDNPALLEPYGIDTLFSAVYDMLWGGTPDWATGNTSTVVMGSDGNIYLSTQGGDTTENPVGDTDGNWVLATGVGNLVTNINNFISTALELPLWVAGNQHTLVLGSDGNNYLLTVSGDPLVDPVSGSGDWQQVAGLGQATAMMNDQVAQQFAIPLWETGNGASFILGDDGKYYLLKEGGDPTEPVTSTDDWMDFAGIGDALAYLMGKTGDGCPVTVPLWKAEAYPKHHLSCVDGQWYRSKTATTASQNPPSLPWEAINLGDFAQSPFATTAQAEEGSSTDTVMTPALTSSAISRQTKCALTVPAHGGLAWSENEYVCDDGVFYRAVGGDATVSQVPPASPWEVVTVNQMLNPAPPYVEKPTVYPLSLTLSYTGADVNYTIPDNAKWLKVTANGAGLGGFSDNRGAEGGKTTAVFDLQDSACIMQAGDIIKAMVGKKGNGACSTNNSSAVSNPGTYGFGGAAGASHQCQCSGAGLSGLFTGTGSISAGSHTRAIIIGGGAGGYGSAPTGAGGYGNATSAGQGTMQGGSGGSGGGGGYRGGNAGHIAKGGTGFIHSSAVSGTKPVGGVPRGHNGSIRIEWITS